jgi:RPEL repeat
MSELAEFREEPLEDRRGALERRLRERPTSSEVAARNILKHDPTVPRAGLSPQLHAAAADLERRKLAEQLERNIESRPSATDLQERNILRDVAVAPQLQDALLRLEREKAAEGLERQIERRPQAEQLRDRNILHEDSVAPSLQATRDALVMVCLCLFGARVPLVLRLWFSLVFL